MLNKENGRILRQGNENPEVQIYRYVTEGSFDGYSWQTIETKHKFISQVMKGKITSRDMEDVDDTGLNYAQVKAIASGNPMILEKFKIDMEVNKYKDLKKEYNAGKFRLQDNINKYIPDEISLYNKKIELLSKDVERTEPELPEEKFTITLNNKIFNTYKEAGAEIMESADKYMELNKEYPLGSYRGFSISLINSGATDNLLDTQNHSVKQIIISGYTEEKFDLALVPSLNIKKINEKINHLAVQLEEYKNTLADKQRQLEQCKIELEKPFEYEEKLVELLTKQNEIDRALNKDNFNESVIAIDENETEASNRNMEYELEPV